MSDVTGKAFGWDLKQLNIIDPKKVDITVITDGNICKKYECNDKIKPNNSQITTFRNIIPSPNGKYMAVIGKDNKNKNEYVELWEQKNQSWTKIDTEIDTKTITDMAFWQKDNKTSLIVATTNTDHKSLGLLTPE
jgi:hypothetical protein